MDLSIVKLNLVYNRILRVLEINIGDKQLLLSTAINSLFSDVKCCCIGLKSECSDAIIAIDEIDKNPSTIIQMRQQSSDLIYIIGECRFSYLAVTVRCFVPCNESSDDSNRRKSW